MSDIERIIERIKNATKIDLAFGKSDDETPSVGPLSGAYMVFTRSDDKTFTYEVREWYGGKIHRLVFLLGLAFN